jgi:prepilin-type N-terminal cleavage/methylation domain-containing protein
MNHHKRKVAGLTLTELLCVLAILAILMALYLPAIVRAFQRLLKMLGGIAS